MDWVEPLTTNGKASGDDIVGATNSTYVLTQNEVDKTISVIGSYTDDLGTDETLTSTATTAVANVNDTSVVSITGVVTEDQTLTATVIDLDGATGAISYQWKADGNDIVGAIDSSYVLTQEEVGNKLTVVATYVDDQGTAFS